VTVPGAATPLAPRLSGPSANAEEADAPLTPFPSTPIEDMLRLLVKGVRAHQLYMHNNPTYLKALDALRHGFAPIWEHTDDFALKVTESDLVWEGVPVLHEPGKTTDSLPWLFYKDGVRELRMQKGFDEIDLVAFLDVVQRAKRNAPDEDDLLVMLWERDLPHLRYKYVELSEDGGHGIGAPQIIEGRTVQPPRPDDPVRPEEQLLESRPGLVNLADFDSTLYFLDEAEVAYLRGAVEAEYASDLRQNVLGILLDIFERQEDGEVRDEIIEVLDFLVVHFLSARELRAVAYLLTESGTTAGRAPSVAPAQRERVLALADRLSQTDALSQLLESLDTSSELAQEADVTALFTQLRPRALETLFAWLPRLQEPRVRELLQGAASRLIAANTSELVRLIGSVDAKVALEAMRRAGALRGAGAVSPLVRRTTDADPAMRLAAVLALAEIGSAGALQALERTVEDADRDVRIAVLRAIGTRAYRPALPRLEAAVRAKAIRDADLTEKMATFETYATLAGASGIELLSDILNGRGFLGRREDPETRACAAMGLGRIGTEDALAALRKASNEKEVIVRNAVTKALRGVAA
jgi:hypothetical protein